MGQISRFIFTLTVVLLITSQVWAQDVDKGRMEFVKNRCYKCHTINSDSVAIEKDMKEFAQSMGVEYKPDEEKDEEKMGGDLSHVGNIRSKEFLTKFVQDPRSYFKDTPDCERESKKKYRKRFKGSDAELKDLVAYISSLKNKNQQAADFKSCLKETN